MTSSSCASLGNFGIMSVTTSTCSTPQILKEDYYGLYSLQESEERYLFIAMINVKLYTSSDVTKAYTVHDKIQFKTNQYQLNLFPT